MSINFQPLLFGGDINVYSVARAFHEAYGIKAAAVGKFPAFPCWESAILDYRPNPDIEKEEVFLKTVTDFANAHPDKKIIKIKYISLGNLIVDRLAFKEYIQHDCNADALVEEVRRLIEDKDYRQEMLDNYSDIRTQLGGSGASAAVAEAMIRELQNQ